MATPTTTPESMTPEMLIRFLTATIPAGLSILIKAEPGVGKSQIVEKVAQDLNCDLCMFHPAVSDQTDYKGLPFKIQDDRASFLPMDDLYRLVTATKPTIAFIDDLGQAPASVQNALMQLIEARQVGMHKVSDHVVFIGATNDKKDKANVQGLSEPLKSRFNSIVKLTPTLTDWVDWALGQKLPVEAIQFIRFKPEHLHAFKPTKELINSPCPRTIVKMIELYKLDLDADLMRPAFVGAVGEVVATDFISFLNIYQNMVLPDRVLADPTGCPVPDQLGTLWALTGALAQHVTEKSFGRFLTYIERIPVDLKELQINAVVMATKLKAELLQTPEYIGWHNQHQKYFI